MFETIVTAGGFSSALLEGIKFLWRKFVVKNMLYDFPKWFYLVSLPVLNFAVVPLLALIGFAGFSWPTDWVIWLQNLVQILVGSVISVVTYQAAIKPVETYRKVN